MEELTSPRKGTTSARSRQQRYCNARFDNLEDVETGNKATDKKHRHWKKRETATGDVITPDHAIRQIQ